MAAKVHRCGRCGKRLRNPNSAKADGWVGMLREGLVAETLCPACTSPLERAESAAHEATMELGQAGEHIMMRPKFRGPA
ncbi:hypothetical protein ACRU3B_10675 [Mycobacterium colombiense]